MLVQKFSSLYSALGSSVDNMSQAGSRQDNGWGDLRNGRTACKRGRGRPKGPSRTRGGKLQGRVTNSRDEPCNVNARPGWKGQRRARGGNKKGRRSIRSRQKPAPRVMGNVSSRRVAKGVVCDDTAGVQHDEWNLAATPVENEGAENISSSERSEYENDNDNGQASADEFDDLSVDGFSGARSGKSSHFTEDIEYGMVGKDGERVEDADDVDYVNYEDECNEEEEEEDDDGDDVIEDRDDYYVEGYMNNEYQDEGNQSAGRDQVENAERSSDGDSSSSSSDYSY